MCKFWAGWTMSNLPIIQIFMKNQIIFPDKVALQMPVFQEILKFGLGIRAINFGSPQIWTQDGLFLMPSIALLPFLLTKQSWKVHNCFPFILFFVDNYLMAKTGPNCSEFFLSWPKENQLGSFLLCFCYLDLWFLERNKPLRLRWNYYSCLLSSHDGKK